MIGVSLLVIAMSYDGEISQVDGVILIAVLIGFTIYTIKTVKKQRSVENQTVDIEHVEGELFLSRYRIETFPKALTLIGIGIILLFF